MAYMSMRALLIVLAAALCGTAAAADDQPARDFLQAVRFDDVGALRQLLPTLGPNVQEAGRGESALVIAIRDNAMKSFALLLAAPGVNLELPAKNGDTALMMAAYQHNLPAVEALLARGARVNRSGWTPLHYAAAGGDAAIVRLLARHGARLDVRSPTYVTALMLAAREGMEESVRALLELGADTALRNGQDLTAAQIAIEADKPYIAAAIAAHLAARKAGQ